STSSSEGAGITQEVPDEPKENSIDKVDAEHYWGSDSESDKSGEHVLNEGEVEWLLTDDEKKLMIMRCKMMIRALILKKRMMKDEI
nr:hypothetical protein [Tanacetum cinerariifolium]